MVNITDIRIVLIVITKTDQAQYHGDGDRNAPVVQLEYKDMNEDISTADSDKR